MTKNFINYISYNHPSFINNIAITDEQCLHYLLTEIPKSGAHKNQHRTTHKHTHSAHAINIAARIF